MQITSVFHIVHRVKKDYDSQHWLFVLGLFLWEQLLDPHMGSVSVRRWDGRQNLRENAYRSLPGGSLM